MIERLKVRLLVSVTWRISRARQLASLRLFAATEADSAWQIAQAWRHAKDPAERGVLFGQILEETHHAAEFTRLYKDLSAGPVATYRCERKALYPDPADAWKFAAYCQVGEHAAAERFKHIHDALPEGAVKDVLKRILRDEAQHVHSAAEALSHAPVSRGAQRRELLRIRGERAWEAWLRAGRNIADIVATVILGAVYLVVGPLGYRASRRRLMPSAPPMTFDPGATVIAAPLPRPSTGRA